VTDSAGALSGVRSEASADGAGADSGSTGESGAARRGSSEVEALAQGGVLGPSSSSLMFVASPLMTFVPPPSMFSPT
jgi:hypothetical protein